MNDKEQVGVLLKEIANETLYPMLKELGVVVECKLSGFNIQKILLKTADVILAKAREAVEGAGLTEEEIEDAKCDAILSWVKAEGRGITVVTPRDIALFISSDESKKLMDRYILQAHNKAIIKALGGE